MVLDLYQLYGLDREANEHDLGWKLSRLDSEMRIENKPQNDPQRKACEVAYGILSDPNNRRVYDESLARGEERSWHELEFLSDFGRFPRAEENVPRAAASSYQPPRPTATAPTPTYFMPPTSSAEVAPPRDFTSTVGINRELPSVSKRQNVKILDFVIYAVISGSIGVGADDDMGIGLVLAALVLFIYFVGCESWFGGTPAKLFNDMEVKNATTGKNLTLAEAARRNLWTLCSIVPGAGYLITLIWGLKLNDSMKKDPQHRGNHDKEVDAIVMMKDKS